MSYLKFRCTRTASGRDTAARVFSGQSYETASYSGTLVLPTEVFERMLDSLVHGAAELGRGDDRLRVFFGPDEDGEV